MWVILKVSKNKNREIFMKYWWIIIGMVVLAGCQHEKEIEQRENVIVYEWNFNNDWGRDFRLSDCDEIVKCCEFYIKNLVESETLIYYEDWNKKEI